MGLESQCEIIETGELITTMRPERPDRLGSTLELLSC
jgi:hypothetical protein